MVMIISEAVGNFPAPPAPPKTFASPMEPLPEKSQPELVKLTLVRESKFSTCKVGVLSSPEVANDWIPASATVTTKSLWAPLAFVGISQTAANAKHATRAMVVVNCCCRHPDKLLNIFTLPIIKLLLPELDEMPK
jgi:hypothetical protein